MSLYHMPHATGNKIEKEYKFDIPSKGPANPKIEPLIKILGIRGKTPKFSNFLKVQDFLINNDSKIQSKKRIWTYFEIPANHIDALPLSSIGVTLSLRSRPDLIDTPVDFLNWDLTLKIPNGQDRIEYNIELDIKRRGKMLVHNEGPDFFRQLSEFMKSPGKWTNELRHKAGKEAQNRKAYNALATLIKPYLPHTPVRCVTFEVHSLRKDWPRKFGHRTIHFSLDFVTEISAILPMADGSGEIRACDDFYECEIDLIFGPSEAVQADGEFEQLRKTIRKAGYHESKFQSKYRKILASGAFF
jgi:hypothetical protein